MPHIRLKAYVRILVLQMHESSSELCELLRGGTMTGNRLLLEKVIEDYNETVDAISKLDK